MMCKINKKMLGSRHPPFCAEKGENTVFILTFREKSIILFIISERKCFVLSAQYGNRRKKEPGVPEAPKVSYSVFCFTRACTRTGDGRRKRYSFGRRVAADFGRKSVYINFPGRVPEKRKVFPSAKIKDPCSAVDRSDLRAVLCGMFFVFRKDGRDRHRHSVCPRLFRGVLRRVPSTPVENSRRRRSYDLQGQ